MLDRLDHIGIAVNDLERAIETYSLLLGRKPEAIEEVTEEGVRVACFWLRDMRVELISPTDPDNGVSRFLAKRGEGIHHMAYRVGDMDEALAYCHAHGLAVLGGVRNGAAGCKVVFLHPKSANGVLIELVCVAG